MAIFEALIGGATTLLGGLFGSKKQKTETTVDYVKMARNAEAAGFNPLTALRNGGSAGFTSTVSHPGLSGVSEAVGQIGGALGAALDRKIDPIAQKRDVVESALLDYQLKALQSGPKPSMMFGDVPAKTGASMTAQYAPPLSRKAATPQQAHGGVQRPTGDWLAPPEIYSTDKAVKEPDPLPIWVRGRDRDGKLLWIPNPDGPELEQWGGAMASRVASGYERAADSVVNWRKNTTMRKLTEVEKKKRDESWLPSWVPRVNLNW